MAVSCPEVMYGAYYPYLYGRGHRYHHHAHFQYDRFNVGGGGGGGGAGGAGEAYGAGAALSSGSSGAQSPSSPPAPAHAHAAHAHAAHAQPAPAHNAHAAHAQHAPRLRAKEEDLSAHGRASADGGGGSSESEGECGGGSAAAGAAGGGAGAGRAQYVSANCVVFTHYSGDVAAVVDEHFARALALDKHKESVPMVSRNLPASFFNALALAGGGSGCGVELYEYDPWAHAQHYGGYSGVSGVGPRVDYHAAHMPAGYGPLLLGRSVHQYKPVDWPHQHHHLDPAAVAPYSYPAVPGLEAQVQESSKDLYWF